MIPKEQEILLGYITMAYQAIHNKASVDRDYMILIQEVVDAVCVESMSIFESVEQDDSEPTFYDDFIVKYYASISMHELLIVAKNNIRIYYTMTRGIIPSDLFIIPVPQASQRVIEGLDL